MRRMSKQYKKPTETNQPKKQKGGSIFNLFNKEKESKSKASSLLKEKLQRPYKYDLRMYQLYPSYYLRHLAPEQKGLLVNHLMGTGKTFTGINFMTDYPEYEKIVVCPDYLVDNWKQEIIKLGIEYEKEPVFMEYSVFIEYVLQHPKELSKRIVAIDEGHNLIYKLRHGPEEIISKFYKSASGFHKIMFLSGTPFYTDEYDIIYIINLLAGETLLPFNHSLFEDEYFETNLAKSAFFGWLNPLLDSKAMLFSLFGGFALMQTLGMVDFVMLSGKRGEQWIQAHTYNNEVRTFYGYRELLWKLGMPLSYDQIMVANQYFNTESEIIDANFDRLQSDIDSYKEKPGYRFLRWYLSIFGWDNVLDDTKSKDNSGIFKITYATVIFIAGLVVMFTLTHIVSMFGLNNIKTLHTVRLGKKIRKYISVYEIPEKQSLLHKFQVKKCHAESDSKDGYFLTRFCETYLNDLENSDFPSKELFIKKCEYTPSQMLLFIKCCYNRLTPDEIYQLGVADTMEEAKIYNKLDEKDFLRYGRSIGNLVLPDREKRLWIPNKFLEILKLSSNKQTVIYSSFERQGTQLFAEFLKYREKTFDSLGDSSEYLSNRKKIQDFKDGKFQYLLLHPSTYEGISIFGAEQLHILEPLESYAKFDQLTYRVVRYNSHIHLPVKKRLVKIYQWITTTVSLSERILEYYKGWKEYSPQVIFWKRIKSFDEELSPDSIVYKKNIQTSKLCKEFTTSIKKYSIENCSQTKKSFQCDLPYTFNELELK